ncbi:fibrocystin-L-like [Pecten maximus]|uniref:fibrocystin-L-like n=1 Tax=Pecten maximus TaxID=6579 RepID=UPI001458C0B0|nr:fibrocystin-L-like [Pecten maximus]
MGLWLFQKYTPKKTGACGSTEDEPAVFRNSTFWNCDKGAEWVEGGSIVFDRFVLADNTAANFEGKLIKDGSKPMISNSIFIAYSTTTDTNSCSSHSVVLPYNGHRMELKGNTFINHVTYGSCEPVCIVFTSVQGTCSIECGGFKTTISETVLINSPNRVKYRWLAEGYIVDSDGTFISDGSFPNGGVIVTTAGTNPPSCVHKDSFSLGPVNGSVCPLSVTFHRFALNNIVPTSIMYKSLIIRNMYGEAIYPYMKKRVTHPRGWMGLVPDGLETEFEFENAGHLTNISYTARFDQFKNGDSLTIVQSVNTVPDFVNVVSSGGSSGVNVTSFVQGVHSNGDWMYNGDKLKYYISGDDLDERIDRPVNFQALRCYYEKCIPPPAVGTDPPVTSRPNRYLLWNDTNTWSDIGAAVPTEGSNVTIPIDFWVVAVDLHISLDVLTIEGSLEFVDQSFSGSGTHSVSLRHLEVAGSGRLVVGWENSPFTGEFELILRGAHNSAEFGGRGGPPKGAKSFVSWGAVEMHGQDVGVPWTTLASTVNPGATSITLSESVAWDIGSEIVVAPTSYDMWESETFRITSISTDRKTLNLNASIQYVHSGITENIGDLNIAMSAEVGLLTRNIKICGERYSDQDKQAFGGRVLIGTNDDGTGYGRFSNVQFCYMGQDGFNEEYDPRWSLAFLDLGEVNDLRPSSVTKCSFVNSYSPAIGVSGTNSLLLKDNVIYRILYAGMVISGADIQVVNNLLILLQWEGAYLNRSEPFNVRYNGLVDSLLSTNLTLVGNHAAGAERIAYHIVGEDCHAGVTQFRENVAHSSLIGVGLVAQDRPRKDCMQFSGFTIYRCFDYGVYLNQPASLIISDLISVDNGVGVFPIIYGPSATRHEYGDRSFKISNSTIVGRSSIFDCARDRKSNLINDNIRLSGQGRANQVDDGANIALVFGTFSSGSNMSPEKPFANIMSYQALFGETIVEAG